MTTPRSIEDVLRSIQDRNKGRSRKNLVVLPSDVKKVPFLESRSELLSMSTKDFASCGFGFIKVDVKAKEKESFQTTPIKIDPYLYRPGVANEIPKNNNFEIFVHYTFLLKDILFDPPTGEEKTPVLRTNIEAIIRTLLKGWNGMPIVDEVRRARGDERTSKKKLISQFFSDAQNVKYIPPYCYAEFVELINFEHLYELIFTYERTQASKEEMSKEERKIENHGYVRHLVFHGVRIDGTIYRIDYLTEEEMRILVGALSIDVAGNFSICEMKRNKGAKKETGYKGHCMPSIKQKVDVKLKMDKNGNSKSTFKSKLEIDRPRKKRWIPGKIIR